MNVTPVSVAVIDNKTITKAEVMRAGKDGKAAKIQAITNGKYLLTQGNDGVAPENITVKRVGKNLLVMLEGSESSNPDLIIEDFFAKSGTLVGKAEDGEIHEYVATDGNADHDAAVLVDGETASLALGESTVDRDSDYVLASGFEWSPALIALGGLAAIAAAAGLGYVAAKNQYQDSNSGNNGNGNGGSGGNGGDNGKGGGDNGGNDVHIPVVTGIYDDVGSITGLIGKGSKTDDTKPTLNGTGTKGNVIEIWDGTTKIGETTVGDNGTWSFTPGTALSAGSHSITTRERNEGGVVSDPSEAWSFIIDLTAPAKGTIGGLLDDTANPPKEIEHGGVTKDNTPTLSGKAEADATVEIWQDGKLLGTAKVDENGNWKYTSPALADGKHDFSIIVVDVVGNKSLPSDPWTVVIDTVPPENKGIGQITDSEGNLIENGGETQDGKPTFTGEGEKGGVIKIIDNGQVIGTAIVDDEGNWSFTPEKSIGNGEHEFQIIEVDPAGNESLPSDKVVIGIDDPNAPVDPEPGEEVIPDPEVPVAGSIDFLYKDNNDAGFKTPIANGGAANDSTLIIEGSGNAGDIVYLWITGSEGHTYHSTVVGADGKWSFETPELADDIYKFEAAFKGADGIVSAKTEIYEVEVDTIPPPAPEIELFANGLNELDLSALLSDQSNSFFTDHPEDNSILDELKISLLNESVLDSFPSKLSLTGVAPIQNASENSVNEMHELIEQPPYY